MALPDLGSGADDGVRPTLVGGAPILVKIAQVVADLLADAVAFLTNLFVPNSHLVTFPATKLAGLLPGYASLFPSFDRSFPRLATPLPKAILTTRCREQGYRQHTKDQQLHGWIDEESSDLFRKM